MTLPDQMTNRWARRRDPEPGERTVYWHVLMRDHPEVSDLAIQARERLAPFPGLHMTPHEWLHMTVLVAGPATQFTRRHLRSMVQSATQRLEGVPPMRVSLGKILYHPEAIMLAITPQDDLAPLRAAAVLATAETGLFPGRQDDDEWAPHVTLCYSTSQEPAQPIINALGMRLPGRTFAIDSLSLIIQDGPEQQWNWTVFGNVRIGWRLDADPGPLEESSRSTAIPPEATATLRNAMLKMARVWGDEHPESIQAVATTFNHARQAATPGSFVNDGLNKEPAYLILMTGNFTSPRGHSPAGGRTPTGRYLKVLIEPSTFRVTDRGLGDNPPPALEAYGPVSDLTAQHCTDARSKRATAE